MPLHWPFPMVPKKFMSIVKTLTHSPYRKRIEGLTGSRCLTWAAKKPLLNTALNVMSAFFVLFYLYMDILHGKFTSGKSDHTH